MIGAIRGQIESYKIKNSPRNDGRKRSVEKVFVRTGADLI
jgi:hypothetical protein